MKLKRLISLLLLAIYLTAWGGPAYVSLSCKCVTMSSHVCCHHCQHGADAAGAAGHDRLFSFKQHEQYASCDVRMKMHIRQILRKL